MGLKNKSNQSGFTIVELLIVIVVIGILAAITIVAYNGVQNRARTAEAQSNAKEAVNKSEVYAVDNNSTYPTATQLKAQTGTAATLSAKVNGLLGTAAPTSSAKTVVQLLTCTGGGVKAVYWNYVDGTTVTIDTGVTTGTCTAS